MTNSNNKLMPGCIEKELRYQIAQFEAREAKATVLDELQGMVAECENEEWLNTRQ